MTEKGQKYLADIIRAIELILQFTVSTKNYSDYINYLKTQSAVERQLGIIGEAVNKQVYNVSISGNSFDIIYTGKESCKIVIR